MILETQDPTTGTLYQQGPPYNLPLLASAARTATPAIANQANRNYRGIAVVMDITAGASLSITVAINGVDPTSGKTYNLLTSASLTSTGTTILKVYPGLTASANAVASDVLPSTWQVVVTHSNANSATYTVAANLLI